MDELLEYYSVQGELLGCMEKKRLHQKMRSEFAKNGEVSVRHKDVRLILMTSNGRLILQRRSKWKGDNAGLWDKTIGGHVRKGDTADITILKECAEELGIPTTVVEEKHFKDTVATTNLNILGVLTKLVYLDNFHSKRTHKNEKWVEKSMSQFYIGYYDGPIRFVDNESCGIQTFTLDELEDDMKKYPRLFTNDMKYILKFKGKIIPAPRNIPKVLND
ncbi:NUDIX hydrolase [Candidatus Woesearchaeota archaeon]|nr:NUDIX hydrolase [Candidatus Woesearchaeota archaeon]